MKDPNIGWGGGKWSRLWNWCMRQSGNPRVSDTRWYRVQRAARREWARFKGAQQ